MCGICGIVAKGDRGIDAEGEATRMLRTLRHRGPDGQAVRSFAPPLIPCQCALGHSRLAVIDTSDLGTEPMCNEDGSVWITFNGEIYGFDRLRRGLEEKGHIFRSRTDTEVILHLYEEKGESAFQELNGIFGLAILDIGRRRLVLARDHLGVKPLFYCRTPEAFLFASEIKAILAARLYTAAPDWQAISDYFTYLYVPCPRTAFAGILQIPPAHVMTVDLDTGAEHLQRFWQVRRLPEVERATPEELRTRARSLLSDTVRRQMVSDVPLGVFLSGGVDSTVITGLARQADAQLRTYTVTFGGQENTAYDESAQARDTSRQLGTQHTELHVGPPCPDAVLASMAHMDQPFGNPTAYLTYAIAREARKEITVALCGAGGDELYAGYPRYQALRISRRLQFLPTALMRQAASPLRRIRDSYRSMTFRRAREFFEGWDADEVQRFANWTYFYGRRKHRLFGPAMPGNALAAERVLCERLDESPLAERDNRTLHMDVDTFLLDNLLGYTDRMSMAASLEARVPLLDPDFVEFSLNVPFKQKLRGGRTKALLRDAFAEFFVPSVARAPKRGFNPPLARWMLDTFDGYFASPDTPGSAWADGVLNWAEVQSLRADLRAGRADTSYELFGIMVFDVWWRSTFASAGPAS